MSQLTFDEGSQSQLRNIDISNAVSHNTPALVRWGIAKNVQQANILMLVTTVICIAIAITVFITNSQKGNTVYQEDFTADEINRMLPHMRDNLPSKNK